MNNAAMYKLTYGLFVLTTNDGKKDTGCIVNTAIQVASDPNRIAISVNKANYTHDVINETKKFTVSMISQDVDFELFKRFGFQSGRDVNKFDGFEDVKRGENGLLYLTKWVNAYISGEVEFTLDLGSHTLFVAKITDMDVVSDVESLTYAYYHSNVKPKPQPKPAENTGKVVWRCKICGYEYEGETLPDDFVCPLCKHPASDFEKVIL